jgi:ribonuclease E
MKKEMLINVLQPEECRIAIIEDGVLEELYVERTSHESYTGNIYKGRIVNLEPAIQAAFVDFSVGRNGFLHVSDVESQYFDRNPAASEQPEIGPRERERKRESRRDRDRGRSRDDRRRPPPQEPIDPSVEAPSSLPPRLEERPRERGGREPFRERERDKEHGRERERPDQSIKGRHDRSERPRRFGEGLVDPSDFPIEPPPVPEPSESRPRLPLDAESLLPDYGSQSPPSATRPETEQSKWEQDLLWPSEPEPELGPATERPVEEEPFQGDPSQTREAGYPPSDRFDPDLPPSRTQRRGRGRTQVPPGRARQETSSKPRGYLGPEREPDIGPGVTGPEPDADDISGLDEPPRPRGGRAAIRSRGGEWERPRDVLPGSDLSSERSIRAQRARGDLETEPDQPAVPERPSDPERRRAPRSSEPLRERRPPHDRAGEPGYVPRRERLRSSDQPFGADLFPPGTDRAYRGAEPDVEGEVGPRRGDVEEGDELGFVAEAREIGGADTARPEGRRRRRRRGRRREREHEPGRVKREPPLTTPDDENEFDLEDSPRGVQPARPSPRGRAPSAESAGGLDELDLEEFAGVGRETLEEDDLVDDELRDQTSLIVDEEIDVELEQEIRREIEEIEELEREMGMRGGPAEARTRRVDEPTRGGRFSRGRGLLKPPIQEIFHRGDEVLVQVIKESIGTKGPTLSTYISIPGRYLVLMPGLNRVGVSRKIIDEGQRRKLREIMHELNPPKGLGFIVRTAGLERTKRELARDLAYLLRLWKVILRRIKKSKAPTPIYQESDMIIRTIRDIFNSEIDTIWIDEPSAFERAQDFLRVVMPRFVNRLKLYDEKVPLFHKYGIEEEIAKIQRRHVPLPEGGSIVIDPTEALVAIDVNSGNFRVEDDAERTAYEMNLRAAKEIARQLRLRDLGGVIVNDFIDMREERHRRGVERALREAIKRDRARTKILRMSAFGLIEMTRQRIRPSLKRSIYEDCPHCAGAGVVKTAESMAIDVMRLLALATHREEIRKIAVSVNHGVATYLSNRKRKEIARFESDCNMTIQIGFEEDSPAEFLKIECFDANGNEVRLHPAPASGHKRGH